MAKIVKFCEACEEGFAEKFAFCPNCGGNLSAFEMSPVAEPKVFDVAEEVTAKSAPEIVEIKADPPMPEIIAAAKQEMPEVETVVNRPAPVHEPVKPAAINMSAANFNTRQKVTFHNSDEADDVYMPTFVEETPFAKSARQMLILGAFVIVMSVAFGAIIFSLFNTKALVGSLGDDDYLVAFVPPVDPAQAEELEVEPQKADDKDGAGGGGGGRKDPTPPSQGRLAPQFKDPPLLTPSKEDISVSNPSLPVLRGTKGPKDLELDKDRTKPLGLPNSQYTVPSDGSGDLGQGMNGQRGQGYNGRDGAGSNGSGGIGNAPGSNYGDGGPGRGGSGDPNDPPTRVARPAVTEALRIISKPRPGYTDEARQNAITGVVRLRVTFLASGQIGGISPVSGLPNGLTEKAIAAARQIQFEPMKKNGVPQSVSKVIEYNFTIY